MQRRKIGTKTQVKVDFASYSYLLNGIAGIGKTTMAIEAGQKLYGEDGILLLTVGQEPKPDHLGNVLAERATDWDDLVDIIYTLVTYKQDDYSELRMIAIDTIDEVFRLAEAKVVEMYNSTVDATKMVKSIKSAFGGFQAGENKVVDIVTETLFSLRDAGYGLFVIGHTKKKAVKDIMTDVEFEVLSSNLESKYYNAIKDKVNLVGTAYVEREMNDVKTVQDAFSKKNKKVGRIASEKRVVTFRDEENAIDVKSHFEFIAPKCEFDTDTFVATIMDAIEKQAEKFNKKREIDPTIKKIETPKVEPKVEVVEDSEETSDELTVDIAKNEELKADIQKKMVGCTDKTKLEEFKAVLKEYGAKSLDTSKPTAMFEKIKKVF